MRLLALYLGAAVSCLASMAAQADCLKANTPGQIVEGRLTSVVITIDDYKLKERPYILRLDSDACLEGSDDIDKVEATRRVHVYGPDDALRRKLRSAVGKRVRVTGSPFGEHTAHHHAPIVMGLSALEVMPRK